MLKNAAIGMAWLEGAMRVVAGQPFLKFCIICLSVWRLWMDNLLRFHFLHLDLLRVLWMDNWRLALVTLHDLLVTLHDLLQFMDAVGCKMLSGS